MTPRNLSLDFHPPASHRTDPATSFEAEHEVTVLGIRAKQGKAVLKLVKMLPGSTAKELWSWAHACPQEWAACLTELQRIRQRLHDLEEWGMVKKGEPRLARLPGAKRREVTWWPK